MSWQFSDFTTFEELYNKLYGYVLTKDQLKKWGYPLLDPENGEVTVNKPQIWQSSDPDEQRCRCGEKLSLNRDKWYLAPRGCRFHSGKFTYDRIHGCMAYSCCGGLESVPQGGCCLSFYHVSSFSPYRAINFVKTKQEPFSNGKCNIFSLDCEMVYTSKGMEVAKITVISIYGDVVFDAYIKPQSVILDYNTIYSGVSPAHLQNCCNTLESVQKFLVSLLNSDSILIGHSLDSDLLALGLVHETVVDTSLVFPHNRGYPFRKSLKALAYEHLHKTIQNQILGHDSWEDSTTCTQLMMWRLVQDERRLIC